MYRKRSDTVQTPRLATAILYLKAEKGPHLLDFDRADLVKGKQPVTSSFNLFEPRKHTHTG